MPKRPAARVFFLVATEARTAVIFRRGPTRHIQLLRWDLEKDEVTPGQWLIGSVDTTASNLSPDGQLLVYCATKGGKRFTAVSRPPYFTALAFWPDRWPPTNGGFFLDNRRLILGAKYSADDKPGAIPSDFEISDVWTYFFNGKPFTGWDSVVRPREALQGWLDERPHSRKPNPVDARTSLEREWRSKSGWGYRLLCESGDETLGGLDCAEWDHDGSLLSARAGRLYRQHLRSMSDEPTLVADLNANTFSEVLAPAQMLRWPSWTPRRARRR